MNSLARLRRMGLGLFRTVKAGLHRGTEKLARHREAQRTALAVRRRRGPIVIETARELNVIMGDKAYLTDEEVPLLARYAASSSDAVVEIGAAFGGSSSVLLAHAGKGISVYSIDPFIEDSMEPFQATKEKCVRNVTRVLRVAGKAMSISRWTLIDDYSYNVAKSWNQPIGMIFIDGDHRYESVKKDFVDWFPHVRKGGVIVFHDSRREEDSPPDLCKRGWPGPTRLVCELMADERLELVDVAYSMSVFRRVA